MPVMSACCGWAKAVALGVIGIRESWAAAGHVRASKDTDASRASFIEFPPYYPLPAHAKSAALLANTGAARKISWWGLPTKAPSPHAAAIMRSRSCRNYAEPRGSGVFTSDTRQRTESDAVDGAALLWLSDMTRQAAMRCARPTITRARRSKSEPWNWEATPDTVAAMSSGTRIVICGGGAIGAAIAYFTSRRGARSIVTERHAVAGAASGKSGVFLALDWCGGSSLDRLARRSFELHA